MRFIPIMFVSLAAAVAGIVVSAEQTTIIDFSLQCLFVFSLLTAGYFSLLGSHIYFSIIKKKKYLTT